MGRIVGIDFGTKRIGIAATDPLQLIVTGIGTFDHSSVFEFLDQYCNSEQVERIIVGDPFPDNVYSPGLKRSLDQFVTRLRRRFPDIPVALHDESFSSADSLEIIRKSGIKRKKRQDKSLVDKVSAVLILQDYLGHTHQ